MFGKVLAAGWIAFGAVIIVLLLRKAFGPIPHIYLLKPFLFVLILASFMYVLYRLYRQGMKRAGE